MIASAKKGAEMCIILKGSIATENSFRSYVINNVLFALDLKVNLLSVNAIYSNGCDVSFGTQVLLKICDTKLITRAVDLKNSLNIICFNSVLNSCGVFAGVVDANLWYCHFSHICGDALQKTLPESLEVSSLLCATIKQSTNSCSKTHHRDEHPLQLVHSDVIGLLPLSHDEDR